MKSTQLVWCMAALLFLCAPRAGFADDSTQCIVSGTWRVPGQSGEIGTADVIATAAGSQAVLLGEIHSNPQHHRWQLHTIAALHAYNPALAIGFEMFPRSVQPVLNRYIAGELGDQELLDEVNWSSIWNFPQGYYLPLFQFARMHRLPMIALNVERSLVSAVAAKGWAEIPVEQREGVTDPAPASAEYIEVLQNVFGGHRPPVEETSENADKENASHPQPGHAETGHKGAAEDEAEASETDAAFDRFVAAQLTWDRAMAQALHEALLAEPEGRTVVGVMGRGHLEYRHGVPHQLADLGVSDSMVLLPADVDENCQTLPGGLADAVFGVDLPADTPPQPRLGVQIRDAEDNGVVVEKVVDESVAAGAGVKDLDIIVAAAGVSVENTAELIRIISRQAPGTWLPLTVLRGSDTKELVARFPAKFE